jgi:restriction system protein
MRMTGSYGVARRRSSRRKDGSNLVVGIVILAAIFLRNMNFGQVFFILFVILLVGAILTGIYYLFRTKEPAPVLAPRWPRAQTSSTDNSPQSFNDLLNSHASFEQDQVEEGPHYGESGQWWSSKLLSALEWKRFETVCAEYLRMIGLDPRETRIGADGGVDIWVYRPGKEKPVGIVQCKAWTTYKVGVKPVRELYGVMAAEGIANGKFMTSGDFTREALEFADGKKLRLISGARFLAAIKRLPEDKQQELLDVALEGDYRIPTCPRCGIKMKVRQGRGGGRPFWGCPGFPRCRATLGYKLEEALRVVF